jgi:integrase
MASISKRSRDKGKKNKPYWIEYVDADGGRAFAKGFTDKGLTEQLAAKLENEVLLRKRGMIDPAQERLLAIRQSPLADHLAAFERSLENATPKHRKLTMTRVRRLVEGSGFATLGEVDAEAVENCLKAIRLAEDLGARTYNHYLQAIDEFGKWLAATKRLPANPVAGIERLNSETDVRHKRRALTPEEVSRLIQSARESGRVIQGYDGETRARAYLTSFFTGLRRQELGGLTPRSFRLDDAQPILKVAAACSKHRREDTLPIHPELAGMLREWVSDLGPDDLLFPRIERKKTWLMVKLDLERIGIPYETHEGIADFHAAGRHSHITGLLRNGATLVEARELARHADVRMTMKYTHIGLDDQAAALAGLPLPLNASKNSWPGIGRDSGGAQGQKLSAAGSEADDEEGPENEKTPAGAGVSSFRVSDCQEQSVDVSSGGGGNCTRGRLDASCFRKRGFRHLLSPLSARCLRRCGTSRTGRKLAPPDAFGQGNDPRSGQGPLRLFDQPDIMRVWIHLSGREKTARLSCKQAIFLSGKVRAWPIPLHVDSFEEGIPFSESVGHLLGAAPIAGPGLRDHFSEFLVAGLREDASRMSFVNPLCILLQLLGILEREGREEHLERFAVLALVRGGRATGGECQYQRGEQECTRQWLWHGCGLR